MATDLPGTPDTTWQRLTPGAAVSDNLLSQITAQAAAALAAAEAAEANSETAIVQATGAANSAANAEAAAVTASTAASNATTNATAAANSAAAAAAAAEAAEGVASGQVKVSKDGGAQTVVNVLDLDDGLAITIAGATAQIRTPINRSDVAITPGAMIMHQIVTGTVAIGALSSVRYVYADNKVWLRLYATAADRTADASRTIHDDPTTDVVLDVILSASLAAAFEPTLLMNGDNPRSNNLYYSIELLQPTGGSGFDVADNHLPGTGSQVTPLSSVTPTAPGSTGFTHYEYTGTQANFIIDEFGEIASLNSGAAFIPLRTNVDLVDDNFDLIGDFFRFSVDQNADAAGFCFNVPNTAIGSYDNFNYYRVTISRSSSTEVEAKLEHIDFDGSVSQIDSVDHIAMGANAGLRLRVNVNALHVKVYQSVYNTGASETLIFEDDISIDHRDGNHRRLGVMTHRQLSSSGIQVASWSLTAGGISTISPTVTVRRTRLEEAAV